ncbi:MAG TPA: prepilin-type N-terminal cleavage/methylation domain-containing protein [Verrucomicrobiae bacterium]
MKNFPLHRAQARRHAGGFTLVEMMVSVAIGVVVIGCIAALTIVSGWHFAAISNYTLMDDKSRNALDKISKEIRNSTSLVDCRTNNPQYLRFTNTLGADGATITYDGTARTLTLSKPNLPDQLLLTYCDTFSFQLFNRYPNLTGGNFSFYASTNFTTGAVDPQFTKVVNMTWRCTRTVLGSKLNTEVVQTAQIVLRNKVRSGAP